MDKQSFDISLVVIIITTVFAVIPTILRDDRSYYNLIIFIASVAVIFYNVYIWKESSTNNKLGRDLFFNLFGVYPDRVEYGGKSLSQHDRLTLGIYGPASRLRFYLKGKVFQGFVNKEELKLYMQEPIHIPVYDTTPIPVWKEPKKWYDTGNPKKIEYYDDMRTPVRIDYLSETGMLKNTSWRMYKGTRETWNMKKHEWIPQLNA
jgi:hypothetical protein